MSFFKDTFQKIKDSRLATGDSEDEIFDDGTEGEDYTTEKSPSSTADSIFGEDSSADNGDWFKYSPTSAFGGGATPEPKAFSAPAPASSPAPFATVPAETPSQPKLFDIKAAKKPKFKLSFITLQDMYDAKNVANLMMDNDTIVVVNIDNLSQRDKRRAMDFLDGAKYVAKSVHVQFTETMYAYIPDDIELHGDFLDQVEISSLDDTKF